MLSEIKVKLRYFSNNPLMDIGALEAIEREIDELPGIIKEKNGSVHVCFDCLNEGRLDVHNKNIKTSGVKI